MDLALEAVSGAAGPVPAVPEEYVFGHLQAVISITSTQSGPWETPACTREKKANYELRSGSMRLRGEKYEAHCMLAHDMINRFAVIVGYCDLLLEQPPSDPMVSRRLLLMREIAKSAAGELVQRECPFRGSAELPVPAEEALPRRV